MIDGSTDTDVLNVDNLGKEVSSPEGALTILEGVSFHVDAGETVAVLGPSGAGKSTLLALMAGLDTPNSGSV
ncbi:MAG: ATP-binding cassette domain-containing protein, partial [Gammaproteobacteria bacterium]